jgi:enolase
MSNNDPIDVHRALQKAARELAHNADHGTEAGYLEAIDNLEEKLQAVRALRNPIERMQEILGDIYRDVGRAIEIATGSPLTMAEKYDMYAASVEEK